MIWVKFAIVHSHTHTISADPIFFPVIWSNNPLVNITNLYEIQLGKSNVPGDLNLCWQTHMIKKKWGGTELRNRKCTLFISSNGVYLYHICIFIFFICYLCLFFHIEKEDKLSSFFYMKRTQAYRKKLTPASLTHVLIKSFLFLWVLGS